ncbi:MAG: hypothetical protein LUG55_08285 [Clostridiales bacterium]|nr:hypothetical protein [Clostridiales bacterium]
MSTERHRSPIKALVVGEFVYSENSQMMMAVGAYRDVEKAWGAAYLFLISDLDEDDEDVKYTVTEPWTLEGETGFGITLKKAEGKVERNVYVLMNDGQEAEGE